MHRVLYNRATFSLSIQPSGPLLVKAGGLSPNPALPDMQFVRCTYGGRETVYIPGSSLKGVIRSYIEKYLRTIHAEACNPFPKESCASKWESKDVPSYQKYRQSCHACKIFGNTAIKGRAFIQDAVPQGEVKTETRHGVAINRQTHAVAAGPFDFEVAVSGDFRSLITLENFEAWQFALIAVAVRGLNEGQIRIGFGKNRGFGEVTAAVSQCRVLAVKAPPEDSIWGIGGFATDEDVRRYGLHRDDVIRPGVTASQEDSDLWGTARSYSADKWPAIEKACLQAARALPEEQRQ